MSKKRQRQSITTEELLNLRTGKRPIGARVNKEWFDVQNVNGTPTIYIYDEISFWGITAQDIVDRIQELGDVDQIDVRVNSPGGSVFQGITIFNLLRDHSANITVHIDGLAGSIASTIILAGDEILIPENGMVMIHEPTTFLWGTAEDLRKEAGVLEKVTDTIVNGYVENTKLSAFEARQLMKAETWMTADEAIEKGFATTKVGAVDMAACADMDFSAFSKMPQNVFNREEPKEPEKPEPENQEEESPAPKTYPTSVKRKKLTLLEEEPSSASATT